MDGPAASTCDATVGRTMNASSKVELGSTGDPPVSSGHWPDGMEGAFALAMGKSSSISSVSSGKLPLGTGQWPVLPKQVAVAMLSLAAIAIAKIGLLHATDEAPFGIDHRIPWITSRVAGSPEPPLPFTVEKTFTNIQWRAPIFVAAEPGTDHLLVVQAGGEKERPSKILRVLDNANAAEVETFLTLSNRLIYSFAFHPGYRTNGQLFVFTHGSSGEFARTNRISRFNVERGASHRFDPLSEHNIIEWRSEGHDGGGIVFGHDGMLYISTGDGTSDSDGWVSGQDLSELLGGVLRIDVDHTAGTQTYSVPKDNPFVGMTNARPENWAYGLRNPWRLCIDQKTGRIWAGNNGQDLWETAHLIRRGENYGWSVYEGSHPFYLNRKLGPTPAVPPTIEHSHAEFRSLTGGIVYYGERFPELNGFYIYGDYSSGEIWGARHDGSRVKELRQLAQTQIQITAFAVSHHGELLIADHAGALYRLSRSPKQRPTHKFPTRLSDRVVRFDERPSSSASADSVLSERTGLGGRRVG